MKEINGKEYSEKELRDIYKFFTASYYSDASLMPRYSSLREIGFEKDSKECIDLENTYKKLAAYDEIMNKTGGKAYELVLMYEDFKRCLPFYLDNSGKKVATPYGWQLKELEECNDKEIIEAIQKMYDRYIETQNKVFKESLRKLLAK